jgi:hypothetical protein
VTGVTGVVGVVGVVGVFGTLGDVGNGLSHEARSRLHTTVQARVSREGTGTV